MPAGCIIGVVGSLLIVTAVGRADELRPAPLTSKITSVQPMTGIVLWSTNPDAAEAPIQLE